MKKIKHLTSKTFSSLKIRNYRLYFFGQAVSQSGTWIQTIGQSWLVLKLTNSGTQLGLMAAAQFLPVLIFGPLAGVITDRFNKRKIIFLTQSLFAVLALLLALLVSFGLVKLWMVYCVAVGFGLLTALDTPTRQTFVYEMVGQDKLANAISLNATLFNLTRIIGPAIAGLLIVAVGLAPCFYINAASFAAVLIALAFMDASSLQRVANVENIKGQIGEGFKYVMAHPVLRDVLLFMAIIGTFVYEFTVSVPLLAQATFHGGAEAYALLTAAMGLGSVLGGLFSASRKRAGMENLLQAILLLGVAMLAAAISPNLGVALAVMVLIGFVSTIYTAMSNVLLQLNSEPQMRGRVMALWNVAFIGSTPIGGPIVGYLSEQTNPRWGFALGGFSALATLIYARFKKDGLLPRKAV